MKNKRILVTGGGGMVAHFLRKLLEEKGADVIQIEAYSKILKVQFEWLEEAEWIYWNSVEQPIRGINTGRQ